MIVFDKLSVLVAIIYVYAFSDTAFSLESRRVNDNNTAHDNNTTPNFAHVFLFDVWRTILCLRFVVVRAVCNNICICIQSRQITKRCKKHFL